ncbi:MAG: hypothetical protein HQM02_10100 [Magnetococcales bacterium]|nr:hypothetical protein [Magnetococcales bacterium]
MAETRLHMASQGYLESIDTVWRGWTAFALLCVVIVFLMGHLLVRRSRRLRAERFRLQRQKERERMKNLSR